MRLALGAAFLALGLVTGCCRGGNHQAYEPRPTPPPPPPFVVTRVAVLPFDNATTSVDAPKMLRTQLHARIGNKGYIPIPLGEVDKGLDSLGVQLAGQLQVTKPEELREALHADVAISGKMLKANAVQVEAEITMTDLHTGQVIRTAKRWVEGTTSVGGSGLEGLAAAAAVAMVTRLDAAQKRLADALMSELPVCPRQAPAPPPPVATPTPLAPTTASTPIPAATPLPASSPAPIPGATPAKTPAPTATPKPATTPKSAA